MPHGQSAALVLTFGGQRAVDPLAEVDLVIDPAGDNLAVNPAGDVLVISAGVTWIGKTAALVITDPVTANVIGTEAGGILGDEAGGEIGLE